MHIHHRFFLALVTPDDEPLGRFEIKPDWQPFLAAIALRVLRAGADQPPLDDAHTSVEPLWDSERGEPLATGLQLTRGEYSVTVPLRYFRRTAQDLAAQLVEENKLAEGAKYAYLLLAFEAPALPPVAPPPFTITPLPVTLPFRDAHFPELFPGAVADGETAGEDFPVFVEPRVLEEARDCTRAAEGVETGGVLIGHLLRDRITRDIALQITAQIPAQHTEGTAVKLSFTPETWVSVRAAITLRGRGELMLGTWHSHPAVAWCAKCPEERQRECSFRLPFFSEDDVLLHRTVFASAHCVGLVITQAIDGLHHGLFGWQAGFIEARGFHLLGHEPTTTTIHPSHHATTCPTIA